MTKVKIPISYGELLDKITILEIKLERIKNADAVSNIRREYDELVAMLDGLPDVGELRSALKRANEEQWDVQDKLRENFNAEHNLDEYARLAMLVATTNEERYNYKRKINMLLCSGIVEEKIYKKGT